MRKVVLLVMFCCPILKGAAQQYLDDFSLLTKPSENSFSEDLENGFQGFFLSDIPDVDVLRGLIGYLDSLDVVLILDSLDERVFFDQLTKADLLPRLFTSRDVDPILGLPQKEIKRLYVFGQSDPFLPKDKYLIHLLVDDNLAITLDGNPENDLAVVHLSSKVLTSYAASQVLTAINSHTGKLPNLIVTSEAADAKLLQAAANKKQWYRSIVLHKGHKLEGVEWRHSPVLITDGKMHTQEQRVSPKKRGYAFSPDVMNFNGTNKRFVKEFQAFKLALTDELRFQLSFEKGLVNEIDLQHDALFSTAEIKESDDRGKFARFDGESGFIDFGNIPLEGNELSFSAWVRSNNASGNHSIMSSGEFFCVKIHNGMMTYTLPDIEDYHLYDVTIKEHEWQHMVFVVDKDKAYFYINGKLKGEQSTELPLRFNYSLVIGSNMWDEHFDGDLDNLRVWNRALSDTEVEEVFRMDQEVPESLTAGVRWFFILLGLLLSLGIYYVLNKRRNGPHPKKEVSDKPVPALVSKPVFSPGLYLFGEFKLINLNGEDLSHLFSPKKREIISLIAIYTAKKGGIKSSEINDLLWEGYSAENAKNNRSTQLKGIREVLKEDGGFAVEYLDKKWRMIRNHDFICDYDRYIQLAQLIYKEPNDENLREFVQTVRKGPLLPGLNTQAFDKFKAQITVDIIELLTPLFNLPELQKWKLTLTELVLEFDPINETAQSQRIRYLISKGSHTLARQLFANYKKQYQLFYGEEYPNDYQEFISIQF